MSRSPLIWFGGKSKVAHQIIKHFPKHSCYVEPFGGAAHVISQKAPVEIEVYNDIDESVVNFIVMANTRTEELITVCDAIPYSRSLYEKWKREKFVADDFERAVRFFYLNRSGIAKGNADETFCTNTGWRHSSSTNTAKAYYNSVQILRDFANRMKNVMIDNRDFREIFRVYDSESTLFYVDPPYIGREKYYAGGFTDQDHEELSIILNNVKGKVILSYNDDPRLEELYKNWHRERFQAVRQVVNGHDNKSEELLLMNFDNGQLTLF